MSGFLRNATGLFEAARAAADSGQNPSDMTILIDDQGGIRMIADSEWPLAALQRHQGAAMAYRVSKENGQITVEGTSSAERCRLQTDSTPSVMRRLLGVAGDYQEFASRTRPESTPVAEEDQIPP